MRTNIWSVVYLVGLVVYIAIRGVFGGRTRRRPDTRDYGAAGPVVVSRVDVTDRALMGVVVIGNIVLPALYLFTSWLGFADYSRCELWDGSAFAGLRRDRGCEMWWTAFLPWGGAVLIIWALWLFWRAHVDLGLNWSITLEMRKDHELIVNGVYRRVRHPMYAAIVGSPGTELEFAL